MSNWWNKVSKMWRPRQDEYTKLKTALNELEYKLDVGIRYNILSSHMLEYYKETFKRIQEGRNHLPTRDARDLQIKIRSFLTRFKDYGFKEIPINTQQPQDCVSRKPPVVVTSYGAWKPPDSQKCEDIEMKAPTDQSRYPNEPRRQSKRNNDTPSVHRNVQKPPTPPEISYHQKRQSKRGGYKPQGVEVQKQKIAKDVCLHNTIRRAQNEEENNLSLQSAKQQTPPEMLDHQMLPKLRGGYRHEDVEEQKQKNVKDVNPHGVNLILQKPQTPPGMSYHQMRPKMRGGYKPEDVEEENRKIAKDVTLHDVQDIEAQMIQQAQNEEEKNSHLQSTKQQTPPEMFPMLRGGYRPEDVEEQKQKNVKDVNLHAVRDTEAQMIRRAQNEEEKNSNFQSTKHENRYIDDGIMTRQRMEQENRTLRPCQGDKHVETRNINQMTTRLQHKEYQNRSFQPQYEENMRQRVKTNQKCVQDDLGYYTRPNKEEVANRRCYSDEKSLNIPQEDVEMQDNCQAVTTSLKLNTQYQQDKDEYKSQYNKEEEKRRWCSGSREHVDSQNICYGVTTRQKHMQHLQDQNLHKRQDNEEKTFQEENRRSHNDSREYAEHENIHHGAATMPMDVQYQEEQDICHRVTTRQKHLQHLQDRNQYKRQDKEEKTFQEENRRSYNDLKEYTEHENIQHGAATTQMDIQYLEEQYDDEKPIEEKHYTQKQDVCHGVTTRQKKIQHQQYQNVYKRQYNEEKPSEEKTRRSYNVPKEYTEQHKIHTARQNQQQQYNDEKLLEEINRRRHSHPERYLEGQNTGQSYMQYQQDQNQYNEENKRIYYENYDRMHTPKGWGDSHVTSPHPEEYYIQAAREDGTYDRYREVAIQTSPAHQVRGRGRTHNFPTNCQHVEIETAQEVEETLEILDVHQYFQDDFDLKTLDSSIDTLTQIETIEKWSKTFEDKVNNFSEAKFSLEYFVIDEKLMRMIEHLDKLKCKDDPASTKRKIQVIQYIKDLQTTLDKRAIDD